MLSPDSARFRRFCRRPNITLGLLLLGVVGLSPVGHAQDGAAASDACQPSDEGR